MTMMTLSTKTAAKVERAKAKTAGKGDGKGKSCGKGGGKGNKDDDGDDPFGTVHVESAAGASF